MAKIGVRTPFWTPRGIEMPLICRNARCSTETPLFCRNARCSTETPLFCRNARCFPETPAVLQKCRCSMRTAAATWLSHGGPGGPKYPPFFNFWTQKLQSGPPGGVPGGPDLVYSTLGIYQKGGSKSRFFPKNADFDSFS